MNSCWQVCKVILLSRRMSLAHIQQTATRYSPCMYILYCYRIIGTSCANWIMLSVSRYHRVSSVTCQCRVLFDSSTGLMKCKLLRLSWNWKIYRIEIELSPTKISRNFPISHYIGNLMKHEIDMNAISPENSFEDVSGNLNVVDICSHNNAWDDLLDICSANVTIVAIIRIKYIYISRLWSKVR